MCATLTLNKLYCSHFKNSFTLQNDLSGQNIAYNYVD